MSEWSRLVRTVAPEPVVTLIDAKQHLRVLDSDSDEEILQLISAAEACIDGPSGIGIALAPQTWRLSLDGFPREIIVPLGPIAEIVSVTYRNTAGVVTPVTGLRYDLDESPIRIWPARDTAWPETYCEPGAVKITFNCGYATLPQDLRWAILLLVGHFYENREAVTTDLKAVELPMGVSSILERYRVGRFA